MSEWNVLQRKASEAGIYRPGMKADEIKEALGMSEVEEDRSIARGRSDERSISFSKREGNRTIMTGYDLTLDVPYPQPGQYYHWFLDKGDKLQRAADGGYVPVLENDPEFSGRGEPRFDRDHPQGMNEWVSKPGNERTDPPQRQYLMRIKQEWRNEDLAQRSRHVRETEEGINPKRQVDSDGNQTPEDVAYGESSIQNEFRR